MRAVTVAGFNYTPDGGAAKYASHHRCRSTRHTPGLQHFEPEQHKQICPSFADPQPSYYCLQRYSLAGDTVETITVPDQQVWTDGQVARHCAGETITVCLLWSCAF